MDTRMTRRAAAAAIGAGLALPALGRPPAAPATDAGASQPRDRWFRISLAQWSLHRAHFDGTMTALDFPWAAKNRFGIDAVEYVNIFFKDKSGDAAYLKDLSKRCTDNGVKSLLIMCDGEGALGDPDDAKRTQAVENHRKWIDAAASLGCHSIRVNAQSAGSPDEQARLAADGLGRLADLGAPAKIGVIVENHGGLSSNGGWLARVMRAFDPPKYGTLPDFGNFRISKDEEYDRYKGVEELMPFARGVSAKSYGFDEKGNETTIDYPRMLNVVHDAGYRGHIGVEFEGDKHPEPEGIRLTKALLERIRDGAAK